MKQIRLLAILLLYALSLLAADQPTPALAIIPAPAILDIIIPNERFERYFKHLPKEEQTDSPTVSGMVPKTWFDTASLALKYMNKCTSDGQLKYVIDEDNPQLIANVASHLRKRTPLETKVGELTLSEQIQRSYERSHCAQKMILEKAAEFDSNNRPTHMGAEAMLRILDSCYPILSDLALIQIKEYLAEYTKAYSENALFNPALLPQIKFIRSIITTHEAAAQDAMKATGIALKESALCQQAAPHPQQSTPIPIPNSGTISRRGAPILAPQTPATAGSASSLTNYNPSYNAGSQTPIDAHVGSLPKTIEQAHLLTRKSSSSYRERIRAKQQMAALAAANLQPNYIATEPEEIELGTTYAAPPSALDRQPLHAAIPEQSPPAFEQQSSE